MTAKLSGYVPFNRSDALKAVDAGLRSGALTKKEAAELSQLASQVPTKCTVDDFAAQDAFAKRYGQLTQNHAIGLRIKAPAAHGAPQRPFGDSPNVAVNAANQALQMAEEMQHGNDRAKLSPQARAKLPGLVAELDRHLRDAHAVTDAGKVVDEAAATRLWESAKPIWDLYGEFSKKSHRQMRIINP